MESTGNPNGDSTSNVVEGWQRRLLQLDRRNNLLYFKPGRTATLIADHSPDEIASLLDSSPRGLTFDYAEPRSRPRGANRFQAPNAQPEESEETEPYVREGDLQSDCTPPELQRKLGNLKRRAREWQEEQGLSVLSLALGFLRWIDEDGEETHAPLLLLPAQLDRASPRDAFILTEDDEDISHNTTLAVKLAEFGIEIPEFDSETQQPSDYFHLVLSLVASRKDWRIEDTVYLTTFAYSKLAMWRDLEGIRTEGTDHSIVRSFAGDSIARTGVSQTPSPMALEEMDRLDAGRLDDVLDIRDQHTVLPADYSQLIAITGAKSGTNMVIHGPPGTGKSQTIANIIATTIAEGKSVLFVSEKTAALDVVKRRLEEKNLDVFCLDMHSERGSKASVYEQLRQSVDDPRMVANLGFDYDTLASLRNRLNPTVRALHMRRTPLGMTVFQMHGRLADLRHVPHVGFEVPDVGDLTLERLTSILEISRRIAQRRWEFREHWTSRWWALRSAHPSLELANTIRRDMTVLTSAVRQLETDTIGTAEALGMRQPSNLDQVSNLYDLAVHLSQTPSVPDAWLEAGACARLGKIAQREADQQQTRQSHVNRLQTAFGEPVPEWDYRYLLAEVALQTPERELLQRLLGNEYSQRLVKGDQSAFDAVERLDRATSELLSVSADLASIFQVEAPQTLTGIEAHVTTAASIANLNPIPESWLLPGAIDNVISEIQRAQNFMGALIDSENQLFSKFEQSILDLVDQQMLVPVPHGPSEQNPPAIWRL